MSFPPPPHHQPLTMTCPRLGRRSIWTLAVCMAGIWWGLPRGSQWLWPLAFAESYRTPYDSSEDYWRYGKWVQHTGAAERILAVGDSVIWGEYVSGAETLTAELNHQLGTARFANGGLNGLHPLAMQGLLRQQGRSLAGQRVLLHCNLLWMTSTERDLSENRELSFNHARLVPQFRSTLRSYQAPFATRLSAVVERNLELRQWVRHVWSEWFAGQDIPRWTLEHPAEWPQRRAIPAEGQQASRQTNADWQTRRIPPQDYAWVAAETSLQWQAFQDLIDDLQTRGCHPFVIVGPFNAHLLQPASRDRWQTLRGAITASLRERGVPFAAPQPLPSELYADASHPLAAGYEALAQDLLNRAEFRTWLGWTPEDDAERSGAAP